MFRKNIWKLEPFARIDNRDSKRTHLDMRELSYYHSFKEFDLLAGMSQIFWGVAESRNVVDIINQFDQVENNDETDKLGQPLIRVGKFTDIGRFELYYLPIFRERTFPGKSGRQRGEGIVNVNSSEYERKNREFAGDISARYSNQFDNFDLGLHIFYGTNRNPFFITDENKLDLIPYYQKIVQSGVDLQWTYEQWLLKFESVFARSGDHNFSSTVTGFEYTFFNINEIMSRWQDDADHVFIFSHLLQEN